MELLKPDEWEKKTDIKVLDSDGWKFDNKNLLAKDFNKKISKDEFMQRVMHSTIQPGPKFLELL